jgi:hypothetical protein
LQVEQQQQNSGGISLSAIFLQFMAIRGSPISLPISFISWHLALATGNFSAPPYSVIIFHLMVAHGGPSLLAISANVWHLTAAHGSPFPPPNFCKLLAPRGT